jgi:adenylate kinase
MSAMKRSALVNTSIEGANVNIILVGAQGSGKGTQAALLVQSLGIVHIASGDLFRVVSQEQTELGEKIRSYLDKGELVPDEITVQMILNRISKADCASGVLLDGFPRTVAQAQALDKGLQGAGQYIDMVIYLKVPREELISRLSGRYICQAQQHVYNICTNPPKVPGLCDIDGSKLYQRSDDRGEALEKRLNIFFTETVRLLDHYRAESKLVEVDGKQAIDQVHMELMKIIKNWDRSPPK